MWSGKDFQVYTGGLLTMLHTDMTKKTTSFIEILVSKDEQIKIPQLLPGSIYNIAFYSFLYIGNRIIKNYNNPNNNKVDVCYICILDPLKVIHIEVQDQKEVNNNFYRRVPLC